MQRRERCENMKTYGIATMGIVVIISVLVIIAVGVSAYVLTRPEDLPKEKTVTIGALGPLSGPWSTTMEIVFNGAETAVEQINRLGGIKSLGGAELELYWRDTEGSAPVAKREMEKLVSEAESRGMPVVLSCSMPEISEICAEIADARGFPLDFIAGTGYSIERGSKYSFLSTMTYYTYGFESDTFLVEDVYPLLGVDKMRVGGIYIDIPWGHTMFVESWKGAAEKEPSLSPYIDWVTAEAYDPDTIDFRPLLRRMKRENLDVFAASTVLMESPKIINQMHEIGFHPDVVIGTGAGFHQMPFLEKGAERTLGTLVTLWWNYDSVWGSSPSFDNLYYELYGTHAPEMACAGYVAVRAIYGALETLGPDNYMDPEAFKKSMRELDQTDPTLSDPSNPNANAWGVNFDENGENPAHRLVTTIVLKIEDPPYYWPTTIWPPESAPAGHGAWDIVVPKPWPEE